MKEFRDAKYDFGSNVYDFYPNGIGEASSGSPKPEIKEVILEGEKYELGDGVKTPLISRRVKKALREIGTAYAIALLGNDGVVPIYGANDWRELPFLDNAHCVRWVNNVNGKKTK
jgi:hypothetical protein